MQKNSDNFSMQEAMRLAQSPAGQQLLTLLQQSDPDAIRTAMAQAVAGDYSGISKTLAPLLASDDVKKRLQELAGDNHG